LTARTTEQETVRYEYTERGDVVRKRVSELNGQREVRRELVWTYDWSSDGRLMQVRTPEGRTIAFAYDAFGRRIEKRVARLGRVESVTRYAWRGDVMVHERTVRARDEEPPIVEERSYVTLPESALPLAQRDGAAGALRYFVHGVNGFPEALFEGDGSVATELEAGLYGDVPAVQAGITPLRFPGQYADEETGSTTTGTGTTTRRPGSTSARNRSGSRGASRHMRTLIRGSQRRSTWMGSRRIRSSAPSAEKMAQP
jgi:YD repeat-containing protein